jgi:hypothetical protein
MLLPMATPRLRSILSFAATNTAVMCSQALPAMGSTMKPRKLRLRPHVLLTCKFEFEEKNRPAQAAAE